MIDKLKITLSNFIIGVGFGSFFLIVVNLIIYKIAIISIKESIVILTASGCIGLYNLIFDFPNIMKYKAIILHLLITYTTVILTANFLYHDTSVILNIYVTLIFIVIYLIVWSIMILFTNYEIESINKLLDKKNKDK